MPSTSASASDTDSDAPETFTLSQSKKAAKKKNENVEKAHAAQRKKSKAKNQERDKLLKEQAERRKGKKGKGGADTLSVEARMQRAMKEAEEEAVEEDEENTAQADDVEEEWKGLSHGMEEYEEDSRLASESDQEMEEGPSFSSLPDIRKSTDRLPDHIFEAAFQSRLKSKKEPDSAKSVDTKTKKKKRKTKSKDIIIGSKTIRTLPSTLQTSKMGAHAPSRKVQRYIDRSLSLQGGNSTVRGWQRRPANIGVFKQQSGPAHNFVRL